MDADDARLLAIVLECAEHRLRWTPEWRKHAKAKELA